MQVADKGDKLGTRKTVVYRLASGSEGRVVAMDNAGEAEFKKENVTGVFEVEVAVPGKLKNAMVAALGAAFLAAAEALEVGDKVGIINDHSTLPPRRQFLVLP